MNSAIAKLVQNTLLQMCDRSKSKTSLANVCTLCNHIRRHIISSLAIIISALRKTHFRVKINHLKENC